MAASASDSEPPEEVMVELFGGWAEVEFEDGELMFVAMWIDENSGAEYTMAQCWGCAN